MTLFLLCLLTYSNAVFNADKKRHLASVKVFGSRVYCFQLMKIHYTFNPLYGLMIVVLGVYATLSHQLALILCLCIFLYPILELFFDTFYACLFHLLLVYQNIYILALIFILRAFKIEIRLQNLGRFQDVVFICYLGLMFASLKSIYPFICIILLSEIENTLLVTKTTLMRHQSRFKIGMIRIGRPHIRLFNSYQQLLFIKVFIFVGFVLLSILIYRDTIFEFTYLFACLYLIAFETDLLIHHTLLHEAEWYQETWVRYGLSFINYAVVGIHMMIHYLPLKWIGYFVMGWYAFFVVIWIFRIWRTSCMKSLLGIGVLVLLVGCQSKPVSLFEVPTNNSLFSAQLVPFETLSYEFSQSQLLVTEGSTVSKGTVLSRLGHKAAFDGIVYFDEILLFASSQKKLFLTALEFELNDLTSYKTFSVIGLDGYDFGPAVFKHFVPYQSQYQLIFDFSTSKGYHNQTVLLKPHNLKFSLPTSCIYEYEKRTYVKTESEMIEVEGGYAGNQFVVTKGLNGGEMLWMNPSSE